MSEGNKGILFAIMGVIVIPIGAAFLASALSLIHISEPTRPY